MDIKEVQERLKDMQLGRVTSATGLSKPTVSAIRDGLNINPTLKTLKKLIDYFNDREKAVSAAINNEIDGE